MPDYLQCSDGVKKGAASAPVALFQVADLHPANLGLVLIGTSMSHWYQYESLVVAVAGKASGQNCSHAPVKFLIWYLGTFVGRSEPSNEGVSDIKSVP